VFGFSAPGAEKPNTKNKYHSAEGKKVGVSPVNYALANVH